MPKSKRIGAVLLGGLLLLATLPPASSVRANGVGTLYAVSAKGTIIEYDPNNNAVVEEVSGGTPGELAFSPDGKYLFIASTSREELVAFSTESLTVEKTVPVVGGPQAITTLLTKPDVYMGTKSGHVVAIDGKTFEVSARVDLGHSVVALAASPAQNQIAAVLANKTFVLLTLPELTVLTTTPFTGTPRAATAVQITSGTVQTGVSVETRYWVAMQESHLRSFDSRGVEGPTARVTGSIFAIAPTNNGTRLLVAGSDNVIYFVDPRTAELAGALYLRGPITHVTADPDGQRGYATLPSFSQLVVFSTERMSLLFTLKSQDPPERLAASPYRLPHGKQTRTVLPHTGTLP